MSAAPASPRLLLVLGSGVQSAEERLLAAERERAHDQAEIERLAQKMAQHDLKIFHLRVELARSKLTLTSLGGSVPESARVAWGRGRA
ncbi:MAG TPA: hypothetical protein PLW65_18005 [Pseudomonadota bacterium]|nr:hypothetical protein [Pseudomonadota bacterium]